MSDVLDFVREGGKLTEAELASMLRTKLLAIPEKDRRAWVQQSVLSLDGYGSADHKLAATRVKNALHTLESEISGMDPVAIPDPLAKES